MDTSKFNSVNSFKPSAPISRPSGMNMGKLSSSGRR
jgi:hypothetical protein